ncbi:hypothetical protein KEM54_003226, partial [Ascosphaera aggregata]
MAIEKKQFHDYPVPLEGPYIPFKYTEVSNPVVRGHLDGYQPRYDPTVIPITSNATATDSSRRQDLPSPSRRTTDEGYYSTADYRALYLAKDTTPSAVIEALLPLIRRDITPPGEHSVAFLESVVELIRQAAAESTKRYEQGRSLGPLDGVPIAVKDEIDVAGYKRTVGSCLDFTGSETSWCAKVLEKAGAIIVGKTNMHEFGLDTTNNNPAHGTPRNPHNPHYYTGGSSGGSGYAVSAGLVPFAHGADGGGSIRLPSNYCGIYGLKPSHGRISGGPTVEIATTTGVHGPMAATLDDLALAYRIMATPDPDSEASRAFPDPLTEIPTAEEVSSRPKIIGVFKDWINRSDKVVQDTFTKVIGYYESKKEYTIVDISIPYIPEGQKAHALTILCEIASSLTPDQLAK